MNKTNYLKSVLILNLMLLFPLISKSQKAQVGLGLNSNLTFFHKAGLSYNKKLYQSKPCLRLGVSLPVFIKINDKFSFQTGLGYQLKRYQFIQSNYDFPDFTGRKTFKVTFNTYELPILVSHLLASKNDLKYEITTGVILAVNNPTRTVFTYEYDIFTPITIESKDPTENWKRSFSPDAYVGFSVSKQKQNGRKHQFTISYQYGFGKTGYYDFSTTLISPNTTRDYNVTFNPTLSSICIGYVFFPNKLSFPVNKKRR